MKTLTAIAGAVRTALDQGVFNGDITADSSWQEIREYLRQTVPPNLDWPPSLVEAEILKVASDMRPI